MAKYTTTIKTLIDNNFHFSLDDYPIFDENYRETLNQKILNHYYMYEIGFETAELFNFYLKNKMYEIMPLYNTLYINQKKMLESDLFKNVNITENFSGENENTSNSNSSNSGKNTQLFQDTPQGKIYNNDLENGSWATNFTENKNQNEIHDNSTNKGLNNYIRQTIGNNGNLYPIEIMERIKNNIINIDMSIIDELDELFMKIW